MVDGIPQTGNFPTNPNSNLAANPNGNHAVNTTEVRRTISPYDLTSADNPGAVISHPLLKGDNYDEWACAMKTALCSRKKFGFLTGAIPRPDEGSSDYEDWWTIQALLVSWIKMTIDPALKSNISHRDVAKDLWDHLQKRFSVMNGPRLQQIKVELASCKQRGLSIETYYGKLTKIWDSMAISRPLRVCKCGKCDCDLATLQERDREEDKVQQFLFGLDDTLFRTVRSSLVSRHPVPSLEEVYNLVRQEEDLILNGTKALEVQPDVSAFAVQLRSRTGFSQPRNDDKDKGVVCKHCNRTGHVSDRCYAVIGYPEWWGDRPRSRSLQSRGRGGASSSGGRGRGSHAYANCVSVPHIDTTHQANHVITDQDRDGVSGLTDDQWQTIKKILNAGKGPSTEKLTGKSIYPSWIMDTGASHHLTGNLDVLTNIRDMAPVLIILADGRERVSVKEGTVKLGSDLVMQSVFYVEGFHTDLISIGQLMDENRCVLQMSDHFLVVQDRTSRMVIGMGTRAGGTFHFRSMELAASVTTKEEKEYELWHSRMGHPSAKVVCQLPAISVSSMHLNKACDVCLRAKQTRQSFPLSLNKTVRIFELIHCDLWGPYRTTSHSGAKYFLTIVDDYSRGVWLYLLVDKTEVARHLKNFLAFTKRQFGEDVRTVRSDNGLEFLSMTKFFHEQGIVHERSCVYTPEQNGRVERKHRHILNVARALRFQAHLPLEFWGECVLTAAYLINRTPSPVLNNQTPYERLHKKPPLYEHLRVFGSLCYAYNPRRHGDKFESRSRRCVFVGYPHGQKGWRLFDIEAAEFFVSRDVVFSEVEFPFSSRSSTSVTVVNEEDNPQLWASHSPGPFGDHEQPLQVSPLNLIGPTSTGSGPHDNPAPTSHDAHSSPLPIPDSSLPATHDPRGSSSTASSTPSSSSPVPIPAPPPQPSRQPPPSVAVVAPPALPPPRQSQRKREPPVTLKDFVVNSAECEVSDKVRYPISNQDTKKRFSGSHVAYMAAIATAREPRSYKEAVVDKRWNQSMTTEIDAQEANKTWSVVDLPPGKRAIGCQWVYKVKHNSDGSVERYKSRLVALGNKQKEGEDYGETFAPVAKMETVRLFLDVAAKRNWEIHQMDVHNAFLHGDLQEEVYMKLPPGFGASHPNKVCRLHKAIYGLKQAPRCWFEKLTTALKSYGFVQSLSDYSLFTLTRGLVHINILIYVDDLIIAGSSPKATQDFKDYLSSCFHMKDLGPLKYFLGIEVARNATGIYICQRKYALDIISETGLMGAKPAAFPLEQTHDLFMNTSPLLPDPQRYRRLIGRLIYLAVTRPDLAFSVHMLARFMQQPREAHWDGALRIVRYLKSDPGQGILLRSNGGFQITGWCDSDYATCPFTRRSVTGFIVQLGDSPISWKTRKQDTVSKSSAEAEYRAMSFLTSELKWLKQLLFTLGVRHDQPMVVCCDSQSAIHIATNPVFHERTKHIEIDCHFVRDELVRGNITFRHVGTAYQLADIFTKPLGRDSFARFRIKLGIQNLYAPT
ncbi:PREDICTED: uncharacterized protein LOC104699374 [Camelina sativa]|uniref:Uncharacterized protein LOC104699374 n=1 Tax=Camelina sativa TaxID=90675 RepID=A0ABM0SLH7_CAMSA|nr:PREDICTED: uncharacterized protein LOC104699374 [Camelina sativa]